jgi:GNAT superfamily N-acetyltransferase
VAEIQQFRPDDRPAVEALYRRVFGQDMADASRLRWEWQYRRNPNSTGTSPRIWVAREGRAVVGHYGTMPVRLWVKGHEIDASWGTDLMVAPERQRQGLGEVFFGTWDKAVGAALGLGLSPSSSMLFKKLRWPDLGPVPCLVKPLTRRALRQPSWPTPVNRLVSAVTLPVVRMVARQRPLPIEPARVRHFDARFDRLWQRVAPEFDLAVKRDASYLQWKFLGAPHVRYSVAAVEHEGETRGYAVYRHVQESRWRVTLLVDFLADPSDRDTVMSLVRWVDREARAANSDKIRCFCLHAGFRRILKRSGYFQVKSTMGLVARVNAVAVGEDFYRSLDRWHVTLGDADQDR